MSRPGITGLGMVALAAVLAMPASYVGAAPASSKTGAATMTTIEIAAPGQHWTARIEDTPAGRDFLAQLPLTLSLKGFGGDEKIADLPRPLSKEGAPDAVTPRQGDVAFYAPWGNLALFYRDGHHSPGLILLGRIEGDVSGLTASRPVEVVIRPAASPE